MNKTWLIFRHEFQHTIKRTGFIVLTLALPVLALLGISIFHLVSGIAPPPQEVGKIGYVDEAGSFNQFTSQGNIRFIPYHTADEARQALLKKEISEYLVIPSDFVSTGLIQRYVVQREVTQPTSSIAALQDFLTSNILSGKVPPDIIDRVESPLNVVTMTLDTTGAVAAQQGGLTNLIVPGIFSLLLALSIAFSSSYVLQGLAEEKENRLMEILLSSVSTRQLITGKVLGIGLAGLLQVAIWAITLPLLVQLASSSIGGLLSAVTIPPGFFVLGVIYFLLGYLLFAVLSAGIAAVSATIREAQGLASIFTMFAIAPFWFFSLLLLFPNSPIWVVFSIFPFSAPVLVMLRLGMVGVPAWQVAASMGALLLSIIAGLTIAARLLRIYLLTYGKRPRMSEIIHNLFAPS